jgi:phosphoribosylglycinamide formyltransferase-1
MVGAASPARVAVLASGRGSNLAALIEASPKLAAHRGLRGYELVLVGSDRPTAPALAIAAAAGIATVAVEARSKPDRAAFEAELFDAVAATEPDWIVLAGFMRVLTAATVERFAGRMLNIHPSLLPKHRGLHTHAAALAAGDSEHGASVHRVTPELDGGPVLAQVRMPVEPGDTPESLAARLLPLEHGLLVSTLSLLVQPEVRIQPGTLEVAGHSLPTPLSWMPGHGFQTDRSRPLPDSAAALLARLRHGAGKDPPHA